jgi:4-diphosphocytidyl-2-C-methyl-D-erythritol kinase
MKFNIIKSYAKINLSLNVTGKFKSGYHKIESLISFVNLYDEIRIKKINDKNHKIQFFGKFSKGINNNNTVSKLLNILDQKKLLNDQKYLIKIIKNIPQKSGLGGGSMNASAIIRFFLSRKILNFSKKNLIKLTKKIGSDVEFGLNFKNKVLYSNGNLVTTSRKLRLFFVIVKPNFGCSTKEIYKRIKDCSPKKFTKSKRNYFSFTNVLKLQNDLEKVVFKDYPKLNKLKSFLLSLPNIQIVRMTGSGSCILGYFLSINAAKNAEKLFKKKYKNYWSITSKTI